MDIDADSIVPKRIVYPTLHPGTQRCTQPQKLRTQVLPGHLYYTPIVTPAPQLESLRHTNMYNVGSRVVTGIRSYHVVDIA